MEGELERLRREITDIEEQLRSAKLEKHDAKINHRTLPPLSGMTRTQKRYFLEPWFTVGMIASWVVTLVAWALACILPWHVELACFGGVFLLMGIGFASAKMWHQDANARTEGELLNPRRDYHY